MRGDRPLVVIAGSIAQRPGRAGHAWVFLQYLLGFQRMGWEVLFLDKLTDDMAPGDDRGASSFRPNITWLRTIMERAGLPDGYSLSLPGGVRAGLDRGEVLRRARRASLILDVNGFLRDDEVSDATPLRVFLDIDPGFNQMWHDLGLANVLDGYDAFVTVAQRMGQPDCLIPTCGRSWITTLPPVVLEAWPVAPPKPSAAFTSVGTWRGPFEPVDYRGDRYGLRVHEFRALASIASDSLERFELALDIDSADRADAEMLARHGWHLIDPGVVASDLTTYENFIRGSKAEFAVAKEMYVKTRSGWISDRSVCYLASGRPVVMQDTGLRAVLEGADQIDFFDSIAEAVAQVREVTNRYCARWRGARRLAERVFDANVVLPALLRKLELDQPRAS